MSCSLLGAGMLNPLSTNRGEKPRHAKSFATYLQHFSQTHFVLAYKAKTRLKIFWSPNVTIFDAKSHIKNNIEHPAQNRLIYETHVTYN